MHIIDRIYAIILSFIFLFLTICNVLTLWVVAVEGLCAVAVLQVGALLELVVAYLVHVRSRRKSFTMVLYLNIQMT